MKNNKTLIIVLIILLLLIGGIVFYLLTSKNDKVQDKLDGKICTLEYAPVCGVNGITYGNKCMAQEVEIAYEGECSSNTGNVDSGTFPADLPIPNLSDEELAAS